MKRTLWLIVLGILVFAGIVIARLPVSAVISSSSRDFSCAELDGTLWNGTCSSLTVPAMQPQPIGDVSWDVHALKLLTGKLNADLTLTRPTGVVQGNFETGLNKAITARNLKGDVPLDQELASSLPPNLQGLRGQLHGDFAEVRVEGHTLKSIQGVIEAHNLTDGQGTGAQRWGDYSLTFPAAASGGDPVGQIRDLGTGPLAVEGTLKLTPEPGFDIQGLVAARPGAPPDLARDLQYLGSPDAQGRRPFGLNGTF